MESLIVGSSVSIPSLGRTGRIQGLMHEGRTAYVVYDSPWQPLPGFDDGMFFGATDLVATDAA